MDGDTAESTADSGNRCETHWVEISERAAQNARLPRSSELFRNNPRRHCSTKAVDR
jgi:hypothetical protein